MWHYAQRQILLAVPVLIGVSLLVFVMLSYIPGQAPEILALQAGEAMSAEQLAAFRERLGLNDPLPVQLVKYLAATARGDLGYSIAYKGLPVVDVLAGRLWPTLILFGLG